MHTASMALLEALDEAGVSYLFANLGSDHPGLIEAMAEARATGRHVPALITSPNEMVAMSAAQGHAQASGRAQAVLVHVDCGTQALGGAIHNAARARVPVLIVAGAAPFTLEGELKGSRNEFTQWIQDTHDQRGLVRGYVRYANEIRSGRNVKQMVHRALQQGLSEPKGPVYLMAAREVLEERVPPVAIDLAQWQPVAPPALPPDGLEQLVEDLVAAERPLIVTSYLGRNPKAVAGLVELSERLAVAVLDSVPHCLNFPTDHPHYQGNQWNQQEQHPALAEADCVLVIDSDVPWIPTVNRPAAQAVIHHLDVDPLKEQMPLWYIGARLRFRADAATALAQINRALDSARIDEARVARRRRALARRRQRRDAAMVKAEQPVAGLITGELLTASLRRHLDDTCIVLNEGISHYHIIFDHLRLARPGSLFTSGAGSLGWNGGAAIGVKLAAPDKTVIALCGDGSYLFSVPSTVHWMARRYSTPFLQVVYNNRGWKSPRLSLLAVHPHGYAAHAADIGVSFDPPPDHAAIAAAAGGAFAMTVRDPAALDGAIAAALNAVRSEKRAAVLDVWLAPL